MLAPGSQVLVLLPIGNNQFGDQDAFTSEEKNDHRSY